MSGITLTAEQSEALRAAAGPVAVYDREGRLVGHLEADAVLRIMIDRYERDKESPGRGYTPDEVSAHMLALREEWDRTGGFDREHMRAFLNSLSREG